MKQYKSIRKSLSILFILLIGIIGIQAIISCSSGGDGGGGGSGQDGYRYCIYRDSKTCFAGSYKACPLNGLPSNSCPKGYELWDDSDDGDESFAYCVYEADEMCLEGPFYSCFMQGKPSDVCPYDNLADDDDGIPPGNGGDNGGDNGGSEGSLYCDFGVFDAYGGGCYLIDNASECDANGEVVNSCPRPQYCDFGPVTVDGGGCFEENDANDCDLEWGTLTSSCGTPGFSGWCVDHGNRECSNASNYTSSPSNCAYWLGVIESSCPAGYDR